MRLLPHIGFNKIPLYCIVLRIHEQKQFTSSIKKKRNLTCSVPMFTNHKTIQVCYMLRMELERVTKTLLATMSRTHSNQTRHVSHAAIITLSTDAVLLRTGLPALCVEYKP